MKVLNDIKEINIALKNCRVEKIRILHKFIFDSDGDRSNRKRIRNFPGFNFLTGSDEFKKKLQNLNDSFSLNELITVCNLLNIPFEGAKPEVSERILSLLCDLETLAENFGETDISSESDCDEVSSKTNDDFEKEKNKNDSSMQCENENINSDDFSMQCNINKIHDTQCDNDDRSTNRNSTVHNIGINYSDIESTISKFNAESHENIANWVDHFDNISELFSLSDLQKFVFAKRSLGGTAALFVRTEPEINSWQKLKQALIDEFSFEINSANLHELLSRRKMKDSETASEYFLKIKELCSCGKIEDSALMHYVIKGINDRQENKTILYGCKDLFEFKEKLKVYEVIKSDFAKSKNAYDKIKTKYDHNHRFNTFDKVKPKFEHGDRFNSKNESVNKVKFSGGPERMKYNDFESRNKICFNCGDPNHISRFCIHKDKGFKCFECGTFGHKALECPRANPKPEVAALDVEFKPKLNNKVTIDNVSVNSLIDTGSQATLLRQSVFDKLKVEKLSPLDSTLSGFGKCRVKPLGYFKGNIQIDNFKCNADICVVENNVMSYDVIIGLNVLMQGETIINENGITIRDKFQCLEEINTLSVLPIEVTPDEVELNIELDIPNTFKDKVEQSISNYVPHKTKTTSVELNIVVKSDEPIFHQPRRRRDSRGGRHDHSEDENDDDTYNPDEPIDDISEYDMFECWKSSDDDGDGKEEKIAKENGEQESAETQENVESKSDYSKPKKLFICYVCKVNFSTKDRLTRHQNSKAHRRTKEHKKKRHKKYHKYRPCRVDSSSSEEYRDHCKSEEHKQRSTEFHYLKNLDSGSDEDEAAIQPEKVEDDKSEEEKVEEMAEIKTEAKEEEENATAPEEKEGGEAKSDETKDERNDEKENKKEVKKPKPKEPKRVGQSFVVSVQGYYCKLCHKFFKDATVAKYKHCRSIMHTEAFKKAMEEAVEQEEERQKLTEEQDKEAAETEELAAEIAAIERAAKETLKKELAAKKAGTEKEEDVEMKDVSKETPKEEIASKDTKEETTTEETMENGAKMNVGGLDKLKEMVEAEFQANFEAQRDYLRKHAKEQIFRIQDENRKTYNLRRREPRSYRVGDLVAIKRTQFGPHLKLKTKYLGPYRITKVKGANTFDVIKEGGHEGPNCTTTCAEYLKPWNMTSKLYIMNTSFSEICNFSIFVVFCLFLYFQQRLEDQPNPGRPSCGAGRTPMYFFPAMSTSAACEHLQN